MAFEAHNLANKQGKLIYEPLDHSRDGIRLLQLLPLLPPLPGEDGSIIRCRLSAVIFANKPKYEALSYVWDTSEEEGHTGDDKFIIVNDVSIPVAENLFDALQNLRQETPRSIWVDAICIDQKNTQERQQQVSMMDYIYGRASQVLAWLGVPRFTADSDVFVPEVNYLPPYSPAMLKWICKNRYWTRLWIIQEVVLARRVMVCIANTFQPWEDFIGNISREDIFQTGGKIITTQGIFQTEGKLITALCRKIKDRHGDSNRLEVLLKEFQHANCSEPRDKIYGFLGLALDALDGSIPVDYDIPLSELYRVVINFFYSSRFGLNGAYQAAFLVEFSILLQRLLPKIEIPHQISPSKIQTFTVTGIYAGEILELGPTYQDMISSSAADKRWKRSFERYYPLPKDIRAIREINESFSYLLLDQDVSQLQKNVCQINPFKLYSNGVMKKREVEYGHPEEKIPIIKTYQHQSFGWDFELPGFGLYGAKGNSQVFGEEETSPQSLRMFLGERHLLGLAPGCAKVGDILCLFQDTWLTALLRKEAATNHYRVVGKAYSSKASVEGLLPLVMDQNIIPRRINSFIIQMDITTLAALTC